MSREQLLEMARREVENLGADRIDLADDVYKIPTSAYYDLDRWRLEVDRIFKRLPLALGFSCELRNPATTALSKSWACPCSWCATLTARSAPL